MFLIERFKDETDAEFRDGICEMLDRCYSRIPDWLTFEIRESYIYAGSEFCLFYCAAGSVHCFLESAASTAPGSSRGIIVVGTIADDQSRVAALTRAGVTRDIAINSIEPAATSPVEPTV